MGWDCENTRKGEKVRKYLSSLKNGRGAQEEDIINCYRDNMTFEDIQRLVAKDEHRCLEIVFRRENGSVNGLVNGPVNGPASSLKGSLREVYLIVKNNPGIKIKQVAEKRGRSESTVKKQLTTLKKMDLIEYRDSDKTGGYYVKP